MSYPPQGTGVNVSDADALVGDVKSPKTFYSVSPPKKTGTMPTETLAPGSSAYPSGYHAGNVGGLVAIDEHLVAGEIKKDTVIFGVTGTFENVLATTKLFSHVEHLTEVTTAWTALFGLSGEVPSNATVKAIITSAAALSYITAGDMRLIYNGVEKLTEPIPTTNPHSAWWTGDALASAADLIWQGKVDSGTQNFNSGGVCYYQTFT